VNGILAMLGSLSSKEFLFVLLVLSGFFKQYLTILNLDGIDFTVVIAGILLMFILAENLINHIDLKLDNRAFFGFLLLISFSFLLLSTLLYTQSEQYVYVKLLSFILCVYIYLIPQLFRRFNVELFINCFINVSLFLVTIYLLLYPMVSKLPDIEVIRENYLVVGYLCGINILLLFMKKNSKLLSIAYFILILVLTGARGPIIFTILMSVLIGFKVKDIFFILSAKSLIAIAISVFVFVGLISQIPFMQEMLTGSLNRLLLLFSDDPGLSVNVRKEHIIASWEFITNNPLLGYGLGSYGIITTGNDIRAYPHNIFLEIWFEIGLMGLLFFTSFVLYHLVLTYRKVGFIPFCILVYILLNSLKSSTFVEIKLLFCFTSLFVLLARSNIKIRD